MSVWTHVNSSFIELLITLMNIKYKGGVNNECLDTCKF